MQIQTTEDRIQRYLERKFRVSRSFPTINTYKSALVRFQIFTKSVYNQDLNQFLSLILNQKTYDPIQVLDDYYSWLSTVKGPKSRQVGYSSASIRQFVIVAKDFLNSEGCKIYNEDLKQKFRLPKKIQTYENGLTKETIARILRLSNYKLATVILLACSSGMRLGEITQLKLSDIDFTTTPTQIHIRAQTTKTKESRITHISTEATKAMEDYLSKQNPNKQNDDYLFLLGHEEKIINLEKKRHEQYRPEGKLLKRLKHNRSKFSEEELLAKRIHNMKHSFENRLYNVIKSIPELETKTENGRNAIHFHAFRYFFKTQVTDAHQSDFAEALMGHKSLKLVYYRQNEKARRETYLRIENVLTIANTEKIDNNYLELQEDNEFLKEIVDNLSKRLKQLENRIIDNS